MMAIFGLQITVSQSGPSVLGAMEGRECAEHRADCFHAVGNSRIGNLLVGKYARHGQPSSIT